MRSRIPEVGLAETGFCPFRNGKCFSGFETSNEIRYDFPISSSMILERVLGTISSRTAENFVFFSEK